MQVMCRGKVKGNICIDRSLKRNCMIFFTVFGGSPTLAKDLRQLGNGFGATMAETTVLFRTLRSSRVWGGEGSAQYREDLRTP